MCANTLCNSKSRFSVEKYAKKVSYRRRQPYKGLQELFVISTKMCLEHMYPLVFKQMCSYATRKRMEESKYWWAVERIETRQ